MAKKTPRARTVRRQTDRETSKLMQERVRLASLEEGGSPERAIEVSTASVIESQAASMPCARCAEGVRVEDHEARELGGVRLRVVTVRCGACGFSRPVYFRIVPPLPN